MKNVCLLLTIIILCSSCEKEKPGDPITPFAGISGGVYISNEGNFRSGNATITYFDPVNKLVTIDPFKQMNNRSLGDICQSMNLINGEIYIVVNNSGKIEICNPYSMISRKTINGLTSPRYILQVSNTKAYVSDLYSNNVSIIDLNNSAVTGTITINGWTEQMVQQNNFVYITNTLSEYLYVVDATSDLLADSIHISKGANSITADKNGKLWVLCGNDYFHTYTGALIRIDPASHTLEQNFSFNANDKPSKICINATKDTLYFINGGIFKMSIYNSIPSPPFITSTGNNFYGLNIDKNNNIIYVSDVIDNVQRGKIFRYKSDGTLIDDFLAGIIPGDFLFLP
jgi:YVTN family beta-propeller protein